MSCGSLCWGHCPQATNNPHLLKPTFAFSSNLVHRCVCAIYVFLQLEAGALKFQRLYRGFRARKRAFYIAARQYRRCWHPVANQWYYVKVRGVGSGLSMWRKPYVLTHQPERFSDIPARTNELRRAQEYERRCREEDYIAQKWKVAKPAVDARLNTQVAKMMSGVKEQEYHMAVSTPRHPHALHRYTYTHPTHPQTHLPFVRPPWVYCRLHCEQCCPGPACSRYTPQSSLSRGCCIPSIALRCPVPAACNH